MEWQCKCHQAAAHDMFINYRVWCDKSTSAALWNALFEEKRQDGSKCRAYLDKHCLNDGEDWEVGFLNGLMNSPLLVLLISEDCVASIAQADSRQDNVLLEYEFALDQLEKAQAVVVPVFLGKHTPEGEYEGFSNFDVSRFPTAAHKCVKSNKVVRTTMKSIFTIEGAVHADPERIADVVPLLMEKLEVAMAVTRKGATTTAIKDATTLTKAVRTQLAAEYKHDVCILNDPGDTAATDALKVVMEPLGLRVIDDNSASGVESAALVVAVITDQALIPFREADIKDVPLLQHLEAAQRKLELGHGLLLPLLLGDDSNGCGAWNTGVYPDKPHKGGGGRNVRKTMMSQFQLQSIVLSGPAALASCLPNITGQLCKAGDASRKGDYLICQQSSGGKLSVEWNCQASATGSSDYVALYAYGSTTRTYLAYQYTTGDKEGKLEDFDHSSVALIPKVQYYLGYYTSATDKLVARTAPFYYDVDTARPEPNLSSITTTVTDESPTFRVDCTWSIKGFPSSDKDTVCLFDKAEHDTAKSLNWKWATSGQARFTHSVPAGAGGGQFYVAYLTEAGELLAASTVFQLGEETGPRKVVTAKENDQWVKASFYGDNDTVKVEWRIAGEDFSGHYVELRLNTPEGLSSNNADGTEYTAETNTGECEIYCAQPEQGTHPEYVVLYKNSQGEVLLKSEVLRPKWEEEPTPEPNSDEEESGADANPAQKTENMPNPTSAGTKAAPAQVATSNCCTIL